MVASNQRGRHQGEQRVAVLHHSKMLCRCLLGSKADIEASLHDVRFTPESGLWNSVAECPLCAKSGHSALQ
jgi:hypothetical protein